jgi:LPS sulfotransferase NodH
VSATRFVIACFPRTGSNWLCALLNSHPSILCHAEVFSPDQIWYEYRHTQRSAMAAAWTMDKRDRDPAAFLESVFADDCGHDAVGIKMLNWQQVELLQHLARQRDVYKVILQRRNRVRAFLSQTRSGLTGRLSGDSYHGLQVRLDPKELLDYAHGYDRFYAGLRAAAAGTPVHVVTYEELLQDVGSANAVVKFLGAEPSDFALQAQVRRQSHDSLRDAVVNFDELSSVLAETSLHAELHESGGVTPLRSARSRRRILPQRWNFRIRRVRRGR